MPENASPSSRSSRRANGSSSGSSSQSSSRLPSRSASSFDDDDTISIADILENLIDHRWLFAIVAALCTLAAAAYALLATPIYTVDSLIRWKTRRAAGSARWRRSRRRST
ncbi:MAG: Wzz/FepE/Etk N-terminal domain-containing protein [Burkholderiaceae bacterium]|nr:Wzz/FepE/Etk N-terminal domain-containing protein [Burkholderiaceae bacterium]